MQNALSNGSPVEIDLGPFALKTYRWKSSFDVEMCRKFLSVHAICQRRLKIELKCDLLTRNSRIDRSVRVAYSNRP
jgi:hypothetical protein